jgi:hypothetical protein
MKRMIEGMLLGMLNSRWLSDGRGRKCRLCRRAFRQKRIVSRPCAPGAQPALRGHEEPS